MEALKKVRVLKDDEEKEEEEKEKNEDFSMDDFPDEILTTILEAFSIKEIQRLLMLNQRWMKLNYLWKSLYLKQFNRAPYWFEEEVLRRGTNEVTIWKAYKNLYAWVNQTLVHMFDMKNGLVTFYLMCDRATKAASGVNYLHVNDENEYDEDWGIELAYYNGAQVSSITHGITEFKYRNKYDNMLLSYQMSFHPFGMKNCIYKDLVLHTDDNTLTFNATQEEVMQNSLFLHSSAKKMPAFLFNLHGETNVTWNDKEATLNLSEIASLQSMMLSFFNTFSNETEWFLGREYKLHQLKGPTYEKYFPNLPYSEYFVFFVMSLFAIEEHDLTLFKAMLFQLRNVHIEDLKRDLLVHVIFDSDTLPLNLSTPPSDNIDANTNKLKFKI